MICALALTTKGLHLIAIQIVDAYGLIGCLAACAFLYGTSVVIDR